MGWKRYVVDLSDKERSELETLISKGEQRAEDITHARILLKADEGLTDRRICDLLACSISTLYRTHKAYSEQGLAVLDEFARTSNWSRTIKIKSPAYDKPLLLIGTEFSVDFEKSST